MNKSNKIYKFTNFSIYLPMVWILESRNLFQTSSQRDMQQENLLSVKEG